MIDNFNPGFLNALNKHKQKAQELAKSLEGLPVEYKNFSVEEINRVLKIKNQLEKYKTNNSQSQESLNEVITYLDSLDIWKSKFMTGSKEGFDKDDSIYYITKENISLRLKRRNLSQGLNNVIQPFMENIVFLKKGEDGFYPSEEPILDSIPSEYCSEEFYKIQQQNNVNTDFVSKISRFYKKGELYFVGKPKNLYHDHPGSEIGKILFKKD